MGRIEDIKLAEEQFISRLRENIAGGLNSAAVRTVDCLNSLRDLTGGTLLRRELESKYPLGKSVSIQINSKGSLFGKQAARVVLTGRVMLHLEKLIQQGGDDEPLAVAVLHRVLTEEADTAARSRYESVLGLFSPTGWAEEAKQFVRNDPPGSGWAASAVHPILIGPRVTELFWDTRDDKLRPYVQRFCGLTVEERKSICRDEIQRAIVIQEFANLEKIADARGLDIDFVKDVAADLCKGSKDLRFATVRGVGPVVKRTI
jgi:hypothetical protein